MPDVSATLQAKYRNELSHLKGQIPVLLKLDAIPGVNQKEAIVQWPNANTKKYPRLVECLELFCFPTNAAPQRWVQDPVVEGGPTEGKLDGLWRMVRAKHDKKDVQGITLTLREGYAQSLQWDEALLSNADWLQESEKYADVMFPNIDPRKVQSIVDAAGTTLTADFTITNHTYTASVALPWEIIRLKPEGQDDGSFVLRMFIARPQYTETLYDDYGTPEQTEKVYCYNVPKRLAQSVVTTYNHVYGASGSSSYATAQGTVDLIFHKRDVNHVTIRNLQTGDSCQIEEFSDWFYNYTLAETQAFTLSGIYGARTQGWEFRIEGVTYAGAGRYTIRTTRTHAKAVDHGTHDYEKNASSTTTVQDLSGQLTVPSIAAPSTGVMRWIRAQVDRFCTWSVQVFSRTAIPGSVTITMESWSGSSETHTIAWNQPGPPGPGPCPVAYVQDFAAGPRRNEDGTWDWHIIVRPDGVGPLSGSWTWGQSSPIYRTVTTVEKDSDGRKVETVEYQYSFHNRSCKAQLFKTLAESLTYGASGNFCDDNLWDKVGPHHYLGYAKSSGDSSIWSTEETYIYTTEADGSMTTEIRPY